MRETFRGPGRPHWTEYGLIAAIVVVSIAAIAPHIPWRAIFGG